MFTPVTTGLTQPESLFNHTNDALPYRSARAIRDPDVLAFIEALDTRGGLLASLEETKVRAAFLEAFPKWAISSQRNQLRNLDALPYTAFVNGTIQAFDAFYMENRTRRFRCFKGEFMYHRAAWRQGFDFALLEDGPVTVGDAIVISLPFSDTGDRHGQMDEVIADCNRLGVPVLIDCAYMHIAGAIDFDFDQPCISIVTFSMSKTFHGLDKLRIGIRFSRRFADDFIDVFNTVEMANRHSCMVGLAAIEHFPVDFNFDKYRSRQVEVCRGLGVIPSNCVIFGLGGPDWGEYSRGGDLNRICISKLLETSTSGNL